MADHPLLRSYGRLKSRPIKPRQAALVETRLPALRPPAEEALAPLAEVERLHILGVLDAVRGNRSRAASILGIDRKTLQRKLGRFASEPND